MNDSLDIIGVWLANLSAATAVTEFALNWLVQSTLLIAAGFVLARVFRVKGSATQSLIYRTTLVAVLICPLATWMLSQLGVSGWSIRLADYVSQPIREVVDLDGSPDLSPSSAPSAAAETQPPLADNFPSTFPNHYPDESPIPNHPLPSNAGIEPSLALGNSPDLAPKDPTDPAEPTLVADLGKTAKDASPANAFDWGGLLVLCIAVGWIIISGVFLTRLVAAWWRLSRLVRDARPAGAATHQLCEELAATIGVTAPDILRSPFLASPCLTGLGLTRRPTILLPEDDSHLPLRDVLVHEMAHLCRHDVHWNLLRQVGTAIYFFQPLLWILSRRIEMTAEEVCDDFVVQFGGDRESYANQLVDIAELSADVSAAAVATAGVGIVALRSMLARRVERIMDSSRELSTRVGGLLLLLVLLVGLVGTSVVGFVGLNNTPTLAEETDAASKVQLFVEIPDEISVGADSLLKFKVTNIGQEAIEQYELVLELDDQLIAQLDAEDMIRDGNKLTWTRRGLAVGKSETIEVKCRGDSPTDKANVAVKVVFPERDGTGLTQSVRIVAANADEDATIRGIVVDENDQPITGATVKAIRSRHVPYQYETYQYESVGVIKTDDSGRFALDVPMPDDQSKTFTPVGKWGTPNLIATSPGYTLNWKSCRNKANEDADGQPLKIQLTKSAAPLVGKLLWPDGSPAVGVDVTVKGLTNSVSDDVKQWIANSDSTEPKNPYPSKAGHISGKQHPALPTKVRTDDNGRFEFVGINPLHMASLEFTGKQVVHESVNVVNHAMRPFQFGKVKYYGTKFEHSVTRGITVEGKVVDAETGKAIVGVKIAPSIFYDDGTGMILAARDTTDEKGRYRIEGLPLTTKNSLRLTPTRGQPYLAAHDLKVPKSDGQKPLHMDFKLRRGVFLRGRVTDSANGEPVEANVVYFAFKTNENAKRYERFNTDRRRSYSPGQGIATNEKGEFQVVAIPGGGILAANGKRPQEWCAGYGAEEVTGYRDGYHSFATYDHCTSGSFNGLTEVDIPEGATEYSKSLQVDRGAVVRLRPIDHKGTRLADVEVLYGQSVRNGVSVSSDRDARQRAKPPEISALSPDEKRHVVLRERERGLACFVTVQAPPEATEDPSTHDVMLKPCAVVTGRLVDEDGKPVAGLQLAAYGGATTRWKAQLETVTTKKDGSFRFEELVPGGVYKIASSRSHFGSNQQSLKVASDLQLSAGETVDLGEIDKSSPERTDPIRTVSSDPTINAVTNANTKAKSTNQISGVVVDAKGKRVAGAKFYWMASRSYELESMPPKLVATTNENGEFSFTNPSLDLAPDAPGNWRYSHYLVVRAPGHGFSVERPGNLLRKSQEERTLVGSVANALRGVKGAVVSLPASGNPLRGRVVDVDGNGVADATVRIRWFHGDGQDQFGRIAKDEGTFANSTKEQWTGHIDSLINIVEPPQAADAFPMTTTDAEGKFELKDAGADRLFQMLIEGERIEFARIIARNQPGEKITATSSYYRPNETYVVHPEEILHVAGPSVPVEGRVIDFDTNEPIARALVRANGVHGSNSGTSNGDRQFSTHTDEEGNYRITGLPVGNENRLMCLCRESEIPYPTMGSKADTSNSKDILKHDIRMKQGVWAEGRVFDADTQKPMAGSIAYYFFRNPELLKELPGIRYTHVQWAWWTNRDGYFRVPVLPTRGILAYQHHPISREEAFNPTIDRYPRAQGAESIEGKEKRMMAFPTFPTYLMAENYQRLIEVDPDGSEEAINADMPMVASHKVFAQAIWPADVSPEEYQVHGAARRWGWQRITTSKFEIKGLKAGEDRYVHVYHRESDLVGAINVTAPGGDAELPPNEAYEIEVQPAGTIIGRLLDADGEPMTDATLGADDSKWAPHPGKMRNPSTIPIDNEGRFRLTGIVPGIKYTASATANRKIYTDRMGPTHLGHAFSDVIVAAGETKDLGDLRADARGLFNVDEDDDEEKPSTAKSAAAAKAKTEDRTKNKTINDREGKAPSEPRSLERVGQVVDAAGNPVAGAEIYNLFHYVDTVQPTSPPLPVAISDTAGKFRFTRPTDPRGYQCTVAVKQGFGLALSTKSDQLIQWYGDVEPKVPMVLRLVEDHPIRARIVDIDGEPVVGAQLRLLGIDAIISEDLGRWHQAANAPEANSWSVHREAMAQEFRASGQSLDPLVATATTDGQGRCEIRNVGKDRVAYFVLSGPNIETTKIQVRTEAGNLVAVPRWPPPSKRPSDTYYPAEFQHIGAPSAAVTGVVRAADTGEAIEGVTVKIQLNDDERPTARLSDYLRTVTDAEGRYRLAGMPMSERDVSIVAISARPSIEDVTDDALESVPAFLPSELRVSTRNATEDVNIDIDLDRGAWLTGSVNDRASGKPISGKFAHYTPTRIGENIPKNTALTDIEPLRSDRYGRFRLVVPQSTGLLAFRSNISPSYPMTGHILKRNGRTEKLDVNVKMNSSTVNQPTEIDDDRFHLIAEFDATGGTVEKLDLKLGSEVTRTGTVLNPDGEPVDDFYYTGNSGQHDRKWKAVVANQNQASEIVLNNYEPKHPRKVHVVVPDQKLAGFAEVSGNAEDPFVVKLVAGATVTGRVLDNDAKPIANGWLIVGPGPTPYNHLNKSRRGRISTDSQGRFELSSLLPDTDYSLSVLRKNGGSSFLPLDAVINVPSGETKALGDVTLRNRASDGEEKPSTAKSSATPKEKMIGDQENEAPSEPPVSGKSNAASEQILEYSGQVLDPNGKPVAGANIYHVYYMSKPMGLFEPISKPVTTSGVDGRFRFEFTRDGSLRSSNAAKYGTAVATKNGFGFGFAYRENPAGKQADVLSLANRSKDIHLLKDHPIRGRIVNIDGEPVAGARLILTKLYLTANNDLGSWNEAAKEPNADFYSVLKQISCFWHRAQLPSLVAPATTDLDGRFEVRGIGEGQIAHLHLSGPGIETAIIEVRTEAGEKITLPLLKSQKTKISFTYYPSRFEHIAGPSVPVSGVVTASDTGAPISGVTVKSEGADRDFVRAITDENGRYRLEGLPIGKRNAIAALAPDGTSNDGDKVPAYLSVKETVSTTGPTEDIDFKMVRGSWLFGRITDSETGKGLPGYLEYRIPEKMNSRKGRVYESDRWVSGQDGSFRIVVPKGRGYIAFSASNFSEYPQATKILSLDGKMGRASEVKKMYLTLPACLIAEYQADDETCERNLEIGKAPTRTGKVIGPDGQPVTDYYYLGDTDYRHWDKSISDGFTLDLYDPDGSQEVYFSHLENNLAAHAVVSGPTEEPLVVELIEGGAVTGRLVDEDGEALPNRRLMRWSPPMSSPADAADVQRSPPLPYNAKYDRGANETDEDGKFTLTCLLPDTEYRVAVLPQKRGEFVKSLSVVIRVKAGESKDLGDIPIAKYNAYLNQAAASREDEAASKPPTNESARTTAATTTDKQAVSTVFTTDIKLPDGQPAAGAHVALVGINKMQSKMEVIAEQLTDANGVCRFELPDVSVKTHRGTELFTRKDGYAVGWKKVAIGATEAIAIDLGEEQIIRGRLFDIDGESAAGEHLQVDSIATVKNDPDPGVGEGTWFTTSGKRPKAWVPSVVAGGDGRFAIHGIPRGYGVYTSLIDSENFAPQGIMINTGQSEQRGEKDGTFRPLVKNAPDGEEVSLTLSPAQVITGKVTCKDSGEPVPNAKVQIWASQQEDMGSMVTVKGTTDENGNYRILPRPGIRFGVEVYPPSGSPYLACETDDIKWKDGDQSRNVDISVDRGVLIRGRILEEGTDKPVAGAGVIYKPVKNKAVPKNAVTGWQNKQKTDDNGEFTFAVPSGAGILQVKHWENTYVYQTRTTRERGGQRTYAHAFHEIDPKDDADSLTTEIRLTPGKVVHGEVVDESGAPVEEFQVITNLRVWDSSGDWRGDDNKEVDGKFRLTNLEADKEYAIHFLDAKRKLGATVRLTAQEDPVKVVLKPCGQATAKFVLKDKEKWWEPSLYFVVTPGCAKYDFKAQRAGETRADSDFNANVDRENYGYGKRTQVDEEGSFTLPALIPGATYRLMTSFDGSHEYKDFTVESGETLDLGEFQPKFRD